MNEIWFAMSLWGAPDELTSSYNNDAQSKGLVKEHSSKKHRNGVSALGICKRKGDSMKRKLTIAFEFKDGLLIDNKTGEEYSLDAVAYAMDQINEIVPRACGVDFLDDEVLVDGSGFVSEEVRKYERQYQALLKSGILRGSEKG